MPVCIEFCTLSVECAPKVLSTDIQDALKPGLTFEFATSSNYSHPRFNPQRVYFSLHLKYLPTAYKNKEFHVKSRFSSSLEKKLWHPLAPSLPHSSMQWDPLVPVRPPWFPSPQPSPACVPNFHLPV